MKLCIVCYNIGTDKHHIKTRGAGGTDDGFNLVNLCRTHHQQIHVLGPYRMSEKYPQLKERLHESGWQFVYEFGVMRLRRK